MNADQHQEVFAPALPSYYKKGDAEAAAAMAEYYSPRTITLGNQSEAIFRSMHRDSSSRTTTMTPKTSAAPYLPSMRSSPTASSRPIRITRRKPDYVAAGRPEERAHYHQIDDAHLSASPRELKHFYDEATWRMYHLIQSARLEKEQEATAAAAAAASQEEKDGVIPQGRTGALAAGDGMEYLRKESYFLNHPPRTMAGPSVVPMVAQDYEEEAYDELEEVFELEDI